MLIGNTPLTLVKSPANRIPFYAKLESYNFTGSVKDRLAHHLISNLIQEGTLKPGDCIVESSSGNFGIALAAQASHFNLTFYCVIDPHISLLNEKLLRVYGANVVKVEDKDQSGNYLLSRLAKVQEIVKEKGAHWVNQYSNPFAPFAYHNLALEIVRDLPKLGYLFVAVSTGGTIAGLSEKIKEQSSNTKIIAVDVEGSLVFSDSPKVRNVPGIGSGRKSDFIPRAHIDEIVLVQEHKAVEACNAFLKENGLLIGGSSGAVVSAIEKYFDKEVPPLNNNIAAIFPDGGVRYIDTVYNPEWIKAKY